MRQILFHMTFLIGWPPPDQQEEQQGSECQIKKISVYNKNDMEVQSLFSMCVYRYIFFSIIFLFNNKVASLISVIFLNTDNKFSSLN